MNKRLTWIRVRKEEDNINSPAELENGCCKHAVLLSSLSMGGRGKKRESPEKRMRNPDEGP